MILTDAIYGKKSGGGLNIGQTPTDGLLASYEMNGNAEDSFGELHGIATDITYSVGQAGPQANFDGSKSVIEIPKFIYPNPNGALSLSVFIRTTTSGFTCRPLTLNGVPPYISFRFNSGNNDITVVINASGGVTLTADGDIDEDFTTASLNHIVVRADNTGELPNDLWVNGIQRAAEIKEYSYNYVNTIFADMRNVVGAARNLSLKLNGSMTKLNLYGKHITEEEIAILFNGGIGTTLNQ